jgi:hypothetical protein
MFLSQIGNPDGSMTVVARVGTECRAVRGVSSVRELALGCIRSQRANLSAHAESLGFGAVVDLRHAYAEERLLPPISHPDPAHLIVTGTGLTHLGSATARDTMHSGPVDEAAGSMTDSMRMFRMGVEGGRPAGDRPGVQPEWFYKGNGHGVAAPGKPLLMPAFAEDAGEEPEIAGIYLIGDDGTPFRLGFALANEFSDHVMERRNYLYLAHSKLRQASFGPEILTGALPKHVEGSSRIRRGDRVVFEKPFVTGEANMSHTIGNLEHHHFKYRIFRQPGDIHVHMFGTATLSFTDGFRTQPGDVFEIDAPQLGLSLRNPLAVDEDVARDRRVVVRSL